MLLRSRTSWKHGGSGVRGRPLDRRARRDDRPTSVEDNDPLQRPAAEALRELRLAAELVAEAAHWQCEFDLADAEAAWRRQTTR